jgi:hypothetical protein
MMRIDGPHGSVALDDHVVEVVGGPRQRVTRLAISSLIDVVRQTDKDGNEVVLFVARAGGASTRFPREYASELDALVTAINARR